MTETELVVGLEVHAQLTTASKLFCGCPVATGGDPNTRTCPVCLGLPGTLPALNRRAVELTARIALALGATLPPRTTFERKHYVYPDLPKNYQISQLRQNLGQGGRLELLRSGRTIAFDNVHLEEDAGKLDHTGPHSAVDFNRAGTPLAELVTRPELHSIDDVDDCMETLTVLLRHLGACACHMQDGNLRFEASVSVRPHGQSTLGPRVEIKNLNSYAAVRKAVRYEHARQTALLAQHRSPRAETRLWDEDETWPFEHGVPAAHAPDLAAVRQRLPHDARGRTRFMRAKEEAADYRYLPDPDIPPVALDPAWIDTLRRDLPQLPGPRRRRAVGLDIAPEHALAMGRDPDFAAYVDAAAHDLPHATVAPLAANLVGAAIHQLGGSFADPPVPPAHLAQLQHLIDAGDLPKDLLLKTVWPKVLQDRAAPRDVIARHGITAPDAAATDAATDDAIQAHPHVIEQIVAGNAKARGRIVGHVMKTLRGHADPRRVHARLDAELARRRGETP